MSSQELIRMDKIWHAYGDGKQKVQALSDISLTITEGEFVAITGPSGSGKSTLLHIMGCLMRPSNGSYLLLGKETSLLRKNTLAGIRNTTFGFVFQNFNLLPRSDSLHNTELPLIYSGLSKRKRREQAMFALESVGLKDRMHHRPTELSGGQKQRVAIARALVNNPSILLADEPTGNLDSMTGEEIMEIIGKLHDQGNTIILVTHEKYIADHANRIVHILDGNIASDDITANGHKRMNGSTTS